jgi:hypothetical protein
MARIVYHMLKDKRDSVDPGAASYEANYRAQALKNLNRKTKSCVQLVPAPV